MTSNLWKKLETSKFKTNSKRGDGKTNGCLHYDFKANGLRRLALQLAKIAQSKLNKAD